MVPVSGLKEGVRVPITLFASDILELSVAFDVGDCETVSETTQRKREGHEPASQTGL